MAQAEALVRRLQSLNIKTLFFEQPLPEDDLAGYVRLAQKLPIPVCLDETVRTGKDLVRVLESGVKPLININILPRGEG